MHLDGCVEVDAGYYSTPPGWIGRRVQAQWDILHVRLLDPRSGQLLREHLHLARGKHNIHKDDQPKNTPQGTVHLLGRAEKAGPHIGALCQGMYRQQGPPAVRRILALLSLLKKHGAAGVDEACAMALEVDIFDYRFVRRYLERNGQPPVSLKQVDPLIRQLTAYRDLIQEKTKEPTE